jgi:hypothetical protein
MSEEEKYIKCKNCRQNILESKMFLHEGFCLRNNKLCPECDKVFLVQEYDEHLKTHNTKKVPKEKISSISEHRKNCHHHKDQEKNNGDNTVQSPIPKKREIKVDDNLGLKQCVYCTNVFEDLPKHLKECDVKKMIEMENAKYYSDLEKRKKEDDDLAQKLSKEKTMDISKDEEMAIKLQEQFQNQAIDISKDEDLARKLQKQLEPQINTSDDEKFAKELQNQFMQDFNNNNIQQDEEYARMLQQQGMNNDINNNYNTSSDNNNMGPYAYGFNIPGNMENDDLYK